MSEAIKLSIQQIVSDFSTLIRTQERVLVLRELGRLEDSDCEEYRKAVVDMAERYIPNYKTHLPSRFFSDETDDYQKAGILGNILYENFREIFYQLV